MFSGGLIAEALDLKGKEKAGGGGLGWWWWGTDACRSCIQEIIKQQLVEGLSCSAAVKEA